MSFRVEVCGLTFCFFASHSFIPPDYNEFFLHQSSPRSFHYLVHLPALQFGPVSFFFRRKSLTAVTPRRGMCNERARKHLSILFSRQTDPPICWKRTSMTTTTWEQTWTQLFQIPLGEDGLFKYFSQPTGELRTLSRMKTSSSFRGRSAAVYGPPYEHCQHHSCHPTTYCMFNVSG